MFVEVTVGVSLIFVNLAHVTKVAHGVIDGHYTLHLANGETFRVDDGEQAKALGKALQQYGK